MAPDASVSGAKWLDRMTFDVFCQILWFLDVRSISALAFTCEALREAIHGSKIIWLRALRVLSLEQSIAPRSLEALTSVSDLRAAATRWFRIRAALKHHDLPLSLRIDQYRLDYGEIFDVPSPTFTPPTLLPGGRWLVSVATDEGESCLVCWDVQKKAVISNNNSKQTYYSLQPAAHMLLGGGFTVKRYGNYWAQVQGTPEADGVIIALRASNRAGARIHRIVQLRWDDDNSPPKFILRAELDNDAQYIDDGGSHPYILQGDYLAIDSYDSIFLWNWKNDTVCTISDPERREWAGDGGFWMSVQPPFLFVFPCGIERIVQIPFPPFVSRGSYTGDATPHAHSVIVFECVGNSKPVSMNSWQPATARPGIDIVPTYGDEPDYVIHLSPANKQVAPLRCIAQPTEIFKRTPLTSINIVGPDGDALMCRILPKDGEFEVKVDMFPQHADGHFLPAHSRTWDMSELGLGDGPITSGPICPVSGAMLIERVDPWVRLRRVGEISTVCIVNFD